MSTHKRTSCFSHQFRCFDELIQKMKWLEIWCVCVLPSQWSRRRREIDWKREREREIEFCDRLTIIANDRQTYHEHFEMWEFNSATARNASSCTQYVFSRGNNLFLFDFSDQHDLANTCRFTIIHELNSAHISRLFKKKKKTHPSRACVAVLHCIIYT